VKYILRRIAAVIPVMAVVAVVVFLVLRGMFSSKAD